MKFFQAHRRTLLAFAVCLVGSSHASAQGDAIVSQVGYSGANGNAMTYYGQSAGLAAYSFSLTHCNLGNQGLPWTTGSGQDHPVSSRNLFRLKGRRFEQLGQSWLTHGFCALCMSGCGTGIGSGCSAVLIAGCATSNGAALSDGQTGGPKFTVDSVGGDHLHPDPMPSGDLTLRGRLQVLVADVDPAANAGARYWAEGMVVHYEEQQNGLGANNACWREVQFSAGLGMTGADPANHTGETAVHAWRDADPGVFIQQVTNLDEGGPGVHGYLQVASRFWDNGDGTWDYTYVVYNQNSSRGISSLAIPSSGSVSFSNLWFNDVDYHSGEPQDGTDWSMTVGPSAVHWSCPETYAQNANANAIHWGTAYSFGFTADAGPVADVGELELFEPGAGGVLLLPLEGPIVPPGTAWSKYCFGDGTGAVCPCSNYSGSQTGCTNTSGVGAELIGGGSAFFSNDTFLLSVSGVPGAKPGLILRGDNAVALPAGDGILCTTGASVRSHVQVTAGGATVFHDFYGSPFGAVANPATVPTYFQFWYRDPANVCTGSGFNFSNGVAVIYGP